MPLFLCGNEYLSYADDRGSISKRLAIFRFAKYVPVRNDTLEQQIITQELAALLVKSLIAYRKLLAYAGDRGFWDTCPDYFRDTRDEMNENTDHIYMFLTLGPDGNAWSNKSLYFMHIPGREMLLEEFKKKFANYMRFPPSQYQIQVEARLFSFQAFRLRCGLRIHLQIVSDKHWPWMLYAL